MSTFKTSFPAVGSPVFKPTDRPSYRGGSSGGSHTYAKWNPADGTQVSNSPDFVIDGTGLKTYKQSSNVWTTMRADTSKTAGKWYWEINPRTVTAGNIIVGVGNASAAVGTGLTSCYTGVDANGEGYNGANGNKFNNGAGSAYGASYGVGNTTDVVGVALDMDGKTVTFYLNNVSQGAISIAGITGAVFPMISFYTGGASTPFTADCAWANFGQNAFTYTPPNGYNSGLYT